MTQIYRRKKKSRWHCKDRINIQVKGAQVRRKCQSSVRYDDQKKSQVMSTQNEVMSTKLNGRQRFNDLPLEILLEVLGYVLVPSTNNFDLLSFRCICRNMNFAVLFEIKKWIRLRLNKKYYMEPQPNPNINSANVVRQYVLLHSLRSGFGVCIRCGLLDSNGVKGRLRNGSISVCQDCFTPDIKDSLKRNIRTFEELEHTRMLLDDISYDEWILEPPWIYERDKRWATFADMKDFIEDWYDLAVTLVQDGYQWKILSNFFLP